MGVAVWPTARRYSGPLEDDSRVSELIDRSPRVSTLELFFDLVFVFTITQLTSVLVAGGGAAAAVQVVVMLAVDLVDVRRLRVADERDRDGSACASGSR